MNKSSGVRDMRGGGLFASCVGELRTVLRLTVDIGIVNEGNDCRVTANTVRNHF